MADLSSKKKLAASLLKAGVNRVKIDPEQTELLEDAITRRSISGLIKAKVIWADPSKGVSRGRVVRRKRGHGSRKGTKGARSMKKSRWINKVRALRYHLRYLKDKGQVSKPLYKSLYKQIKGGQVNSVKHLRELAELRSR